MAPESGIPQGPPPLTNEFGLQVVNSLNSFTTELRGVRDQVTAIDKALQEVRIKTEVLDTKLEQIKESADSNSKKIDSISEKEADIKASLGSMGMKANLNLLAIVGSLGVILGIFNHMFSMINNGRSAGTNSSAVSSPASKPPSAPR